MEWDLESMGKVFSTNGILGFGLELCNQVNVSRLGFVFLLFSFKWLFLVLASGFPGFLPYFYVNR